MQLRSYYEILQVPATADYEAIHRAYRTRARTLHPDRHSGSSPEVLDRLEAEMVELNEAWKVLGDDQRRLSYDEQWRALAARITAEHGIDFAYSPHGPVSDPSPEPASGDAVGATAGNGTAPSDGPPSGAGASGHRDDHEQYQEDHEWYRGAWDSAWFPAWDRRWGSPPGPASPSADHRSRPPGARAADTAFGVRPQAAKAQDGSEVGTGGGARKVSGSGARPTSTMMRDPRGDECRFCSGGPAAPVALVGARPPLLTRLFMGGAHVEHGPLCRQCGLALYRSMTDSILYGNSGSLVGEILTLAWTVNLVYALANFQFWFRVRRLGAPSRQPDVRSLLSGPLDPGRSLLLRSGMIRIYAALGVTAVVCLAALAASHRLGV